MNDSNPADKPRPRRPSDPTALEVASYLWDEYEYRHDMVWKLAFRITAVAAALLIAPFLADASVQRVVGNWLAGLPFLAIVVILGGLFVLQSELGQLRLIRKAYRAARYDVLVTYVSPNELKQRDEPECDDPQRKQHFRKRLSRWLDFDRRVLVYFVVLLVVAGAYFLAFRFLWLPDLVDEAFKDMPSASGCS